MHFGRVLPLSIRTAWALLDAEVSRGRKRGPDVATALPGPSVSTSIKNSLRTPDLERDSGPLRFLADLASGLRDYLGEVPNSLKGHLNKEELVRVAVTSLTAGGGICGLLEAIVLSVGLIFPAPTDAALAGAILAGILEVLRRLEHGRSLSAPVAATVRRV